MDASFSSFFQNQYQACVRQAEEQMKRYTPRTANAITLSGPSQGGASTGQYFAGHQSAEEEQASLMEAHRQQEYVQLQGDVEAQASQIQYRDQAIRSLQRDMSEVHDMFKDLANLVSEQAHMVDDIEANVNMAVSDVNTAHAEIGKAHEYQKKGRNKLCIAAVIIAILAAIAVLIVVIVMMTKK